MSKLLDGLKEYFENTPPEELKKDWEKIKEWNNVGPTVEDYIKFIEEPQTKSWPCVYCTAQEYEQIKDRLFELGYVDKEYNVSCISNDWEERSILMTHYSRHNKRCIGNYYYNSRGQYFCNSIDEFLKEAEKVSIREGWNNK